MAIFDDNDNDSDNRSEFSSYSDSYDESDDEPDEKSEQVFRSNDWLHVANTSVSYKGKHVMRIDESDDEEFGLRSPTNNRSKVLPLLPQLSLRVEPSSLGKRPPSSRPTIDSRPEQDGPFTSGFIVPPTSTAAFPVQDGPTTPTRPYGMMASSAFPSQVSQSPVVEHIHTNLPTLMRGSPNRLTRSTSFSEYSTQGASTTTARVQYQTPSGIAYVPQTAFESAHGQRTPAPLQQHQASHGSFHHRTTPRTLQYHQAVPRALHYHYTNPEPLHYHQTTPGHHTYSSPHGGPVASPTVSSNPTDQYSSTWSSTSATSHVASSNISVTPAHVKSHMVEEVYNVVEDYLKADMDPNRMKAKRLIEEEDLQSSPEWRRLYLTLPLGQLPSVEDCENLAPPRLKILAIVPYRKVLHTSTSDTSVEPATAPTTEQLTPMSKGKATSNSRGKSNSKRAASNKAQTLRANSTTLFCYKKVGEQFHCQLPRIVNNVQMKCTHHPEATYGNNIRKLHLISQHPGVLDAIEYFQTQQKIAQARQQLSDPPTPHTSKRSKTSTANINSFTSLWDENQQDVAVHHLMRLVAVEGVPFSAATSKTLKALCQLLNPRFEFPSTATLKSKLRQAVKRRQGQTVNYIHANVGRGAITADAWTSSHNKRKYLGITFPYMTRDCRLSSVVIGMERIAVAKVTAEILAAAISKVLMFLSF
ncbi:hypothetical protein BGZ90_000490 [Linnemannia elongata]|nr:hypothetical protein BGZ90_000490 [Linnemannia elongata]